MNVEKRISHIEKIAKQREETKLKEKKTSEEQIEELKKEVLKLKPRITDLIEVGNACLKNGIKLDNTVGTTEKYENGYFFSNSWSHLTGFIADWNWITGIGKVGGGACHYYLKTDGTTIDLRGDDDKCKKYVLKTFLYEEFPRFEKEFYNYIDNLK